MFGQFPKIAAYSRWSMEIRMLGPLRVMVDGRPIHLPARQATILAILALHPNRVVSADRLIDGLWGEDEPLTAAKTLQTHVFQLRRQLTSEGADGGAAQIATEPSGYSLRIDASAIDTQRFEHGLSQAREVLTADPDAARDLLRDALSLWQGPALADFVYEPFAESEIPRLEELRLQAEEELARVQLALGKNDAVVGDMRRAVVETPYREQLWASLMVALVRSGRSAEALVAYRDLEARLREDLDAEPGAELKALAERIRRGDPSLMVRESAVSPTVLVTPAAGDAIPSPAATRRRVRGSYVALAVAAVVLGGLAIILGVQQLGSAGAPATLDAAQRDLQERLPLRIRDTCQPSPAGQSLPRSTASLSCQLEGAEARSVTFDSFTDAGLASLAFGDLKRAAGSPTDDCATAPSGGGRWAVGSEVGGRVLCYPDDGASRIAWMYETDVGGGLIGQARRQDDDWKSLYDWWVSTRAFIRH